MPKKLIRDYLEYHIDRSELTKIETLEEQNKCFARKAIEEILEIVESGHKDVSEFGDLLEIVYCWSRNNGITPVDLALECDMKRGKKGSFSNLALTNLNPHNPSNKIYFDDLSKVRELFTSEYGEAVID